MARKRKGRPVDGVLILDKPQGLTSNAALQRVRRIFSAQKAGHTGSLDPLATGVLPICFGEATKFSRFLLESDKAYYTTATLGETRDTGDSEGEIVTQSEVPELNEDLLESVFSDFRGDILQVPSMFSALKHQGRPLYELARKGIEVERPPRPISIHLLKLMNLSPTKLDLQVECSKGTYIRSLVEDIGSRLGCGAHVSMLRRYKAGHFDLSHACTLEDLQAIGEGDAALDAKLLPIDALLPDFPFVCLKNVSGRSLLHGQAVRIPPVENPALVRVYDSESSDQDENVHCANDVHPKGRFIGVAELSKDGSLQPKRLVNFE